MHPSPSNDDTTLSPASSPVSSTASSIALNLRDVLTRIEAARAAGQAGAGEAGAGVRNHAVTPVKLLVATKTQPAERVLELFAAGHTLVGENRVQEVTAKAAELAAVPHDMHLIGPLQSNKINAVLPFVSCVQSVDSLKIAEAISQRVATARGGRPLDVMVQVNVSGESSKSGCEPSEAITLAQAVAELPGLTVTGLMTIGLNSTSEAEVRAGYALLRDLRDTCGIASCRELSMGMSNDLDWAIAEGATMVRVGTAIFGARS